MKGATDAGVADVDHSLVLTLACPDRPGIVLEVARFLAEQGCSILESQQFGDARTSRFFMRVQFEAVHGGVPDVPALRQAFAAVGNRLMMTWQLTRAAQRARVLIMVSRYGHCLNDLLYRSSIGDLPIEVAGVVSNHPDLAVLTDNYEVPFHHVPVTPETRSAAERRVLELVDDLDIDLVVLARYMQILSDELCRKLDGRAINIHHSMLPSFKGARPYHQAFERGVKLVGATAHYVTADLDEGPIIEQEVARIDHSMSAAQVTALGRDNECLALARAVGLHAENRVLLDGARTIVFR
ncbi:formyltetrahydrofolate deformylase [Amycolatopsis sp. FDAARGOS 1241]|uniref:formyltetrahydrofolate deformylase n=1 Tax=Amycolatopsis sp. FDAARGOS 1241 TaxID=2778070 RepID=UPI00194FCFEC|nr:formyltetrahydrofolate deformylase [Amycolatopsis sp. FDAARGOS 1241]QRP50776.1 formyltetrahydrofolate deformylase [Amycolatopsis sp. FDAARGOS 1241]